MTNIFKILQKGGLPASITHDLIDISNPNNILTDEDKHGNFKFNNKIIYPIGDIHGDVMLLKHILLDLTKCCISDETIERRTDRLDNIRWNPLSSDVLVFCGDLIDIARSNNTLLNLIEYNVHTDQLILYHLIRLSHEAKKNNGRIFIILGNHEVTFNFNSDQRYNNYKHPKINNDVLINERTQDFNATNMFLKFIINNTYSLIIINNHLFIHGGISKKFVIKIKDIIQNINFIQNIVIKEKLNIIYNKNKINNKLNYIGFINDLFRIKIIDNRQNINDLSEYGILFWNRTFGFGDQEIQGSNISCDLRISDLDYLTCEFNLPNNLVIVVGHCVQYFINNEFSINYCCNKRILRIDAGMSIGFSSNFYKYYKDILYNKASRENEYRGLITNLYYEIINYYAFTTQFVRLIFNNNYELINSNIIYGLKTEYLQLEQNKNDIVLSENVFRDILVNQQDHPDFLQYYTRYYDSCLKLKNYIITNLNLNNLVISNITITNNSNSNIVIKKPNIFNYPHIFSNRLNISVLEFLLCTTKYYEN